MDEMCMKTVCMFPVVGYQAKILEKIGQCLIEQGIFDHILFLCPSVSSYNALETRHEKMLLPLLIADSKTEFDLGSRLPLYEERKFREELRYGLAKEEDRAERLMEAEHYSRLWRRILSERKIDCVLMWNGYTLPQQLFLDEFRKISSNIFFLENGYEPRTFIVDKSGINAKSGFLMALIGELKEIPQEVFQIPPDPVVLSNRVSGYLFNQLTAFYFKRFRGLRLRYEYTDSVMRKLWKVYHKKTGNIKMQFKFKLKKKDFVFFPLQVITDSQLLDNSNISQDQALLFTANAIRKINQLRDTPCYLVVKDHPRQECYDYLERLKAILGSEHVIFIRSGDISWLLDQCKAIVTINSSVGYLGLKLKKPVISFGKSIYVGNGLARSADNEDQLYTLLSRILDDRDNTNYDYYDDQELERFIGLYRSYCYSINEQSYQRAAQFIAAQLGGCP